LYYRCFIGVILNPVTPIAVKNTIMIEKAYGQQEQEQAAPIEGFTPYQNDRFGFTIQYPSNWEVHARNQEQPSYIDPNYANPVTESNSIVDFLSPNKVSNYDSPDATISISWFPRAKFLDTHDLKVKYRSAHGYVIAAINYMNLPEVKNPNPKDSPVTILYTPFKNSALKIGINQYDAWRLDYKLRSNGIGYIAPLDNISTDIFTTIGDKVFKLELSADQFKYPEYLQIFQKVVYSFQMTPQQ
jgi:hypothetical protein